MIGRQENQNRTGGVGEQVLSTLEDPETDIQAKHRAAQGILARRVWDRANRVVRLTYRFSL